MKKGTNLPVYHDRQIDALIFVYFIFEKSRSLFDFKKGTTYFVPQTATIRGSSRSSTLNNAVGIYRLISGFSGVKSPETVDTTGF